MQQPLQVELISAYDRPYDLAVASARTCYSSKGIILPEQVRGDEKREAVSHRIASSTLAAGHLTTRQHANFVFSIDGISRHCVWAFLHSHPYYNSEQVSQRYVKVKAQRFHTPSLSERGEALYLATIQRQMQAYRELRRMLEPVVAEVYFAIFKARRHHPERWQKAIEKRAMEVARYILPVATHTYLYHSISALTLMRYHHMCHAFDLPQEQRQLVNAMVEAVCARDPDFARELVDPLPLEETDEYKLFSQFHQQDDVTASFVREFDTSMQGRYATLLDYNAKAEATLAENVRTVFGITKAQLQDDDAIELLLDPANNRALSLPLNTTTLSKLSRAMFSVHYTFKKRLSHTADSQDQRHRMVPAARPLVMAHYLGSPDFITPELIRRTPAAEEFYQSVMAETFTAINQLLDLGEPHESALYLLPNAWCVRFIESGDLLNLFHKWKLRTCFNAQEEIYNASIEEIEQISKIHPRLMQHMKPPCYQRLRTGDKPFCPEGERYCGVPVWKLERAAYNRQL